MDINPQLLARIYAVYEYFMSQAELIPLSTGVSQPRLSPEDIDFENDPEFAEFLAKLAALSESGEDGEGGGSGGGLSEAEQLAAMQKLLSGEN